VKSKGSTRESKHATLLGAKLSIRPEEKEWEALERSEARFVEWFPGSVFPGPSRLDLRVSRRIEAAGMKIILRFGSFGDANFEEAAESLRSWLAATGSTGVILATSPSRTALTGGMGGAFEARFRLEQALGCEIFLDRTSASPLLSGFVPDPAWDSPFRASAVSYWKLHGWHPDRWIRRYGEAQLAAVAERIRKARPRHVCLAHSGRFEELKVLAPLLA
jgi:hypothetical protein